MKFRKTVSLNSENNMKRLTTLYGENAEYIFFFNIESDGKGQKK
jgi:hypothetical protein